MKRSKSQKILGFFAFLHITFGTLGLLLCLLVYLQQRGAISFMPQEIIAVMSKTQDVVSSAISSFVSLIAGILINNAARNNRDVMPVFVISLLDVLLSIAGLVVTVKTNGSQQTVINNVVSLVLGGVLLFLLNNVRKERKA